MFLIFSPKHIFNVFELDFQRKLQESQLTIAKELASMRPETREKSLSAIKREVIAATILCWLIYRHPFISSFEIVRRGGGTKDHPVNAKL